MHLTALNEETYFKRSVHLAHLAHLAHFSHLEQCQLYQFYNKFVLAEEYGQYYGQMNTMNPHTMRTMKQQHEGLPYEEMGYCPPPNRKLPPVPGQHSNYNTIDRIKNGKLVRSD